MCVCVCARVCVWMAGNGCGPLLFWQKVANGSGSKKTDKLQNGCQRFKMAARLRERANTHTHMHAHTHRQAVWQMLACDRKY